MPRRPKDTAAAKNRKLRELVRKIDKARVAAGQCRHCGGPVPCWSAFGDVAVGRRRRLRF